MNNTIDNEESYKMEGFYGPHFRQKYKNVEIREYLIGTYHGKHIKMFMVTDQLYEIIKRDIDKTRLNIETALTDDTKLKYYRRFKDKYGFLLQNVICKGTYNKNNDKIIEYINNKYKTVVPFENGLLELLKTKLTKFIIYERGNYLYTRSMP